jgi:hypothetical protein
MQAFQLKDLLEAIGPTASLIFAAWIFLSFLQARYTTANERYRSLLDEFRQHTSQDARRSSLRDQITEYKRRCEQMRLATNMGVSAAILPELLPEPCVVLPPASARLLDEVLVLSLTYLLVSIRKSHCS